MGDMNLELEIEPSVESADSSEDGLSGEEYREITGMEEQGQEEGEADRGVGQDDDADDTNGKEGDFSKKTKKKDKTNLTVVETAEGDGNEESTNRRIVRDSAIETPGNRRITVNLTAEKLADQRTIEDSSIKGDFIDEHTHHYRQGVDVARPLSNAGEKVARAVEENLNQSDENYKAGKKELSKVAKPVGEVLSIAEAMSEVSALQNEMEEISKAAVVAQKQIDCGVIKTEDLHLPKNELREKLKYISPAEAKAIQKHARAICDLVQVRSALIGQENDILRLPEDVQEHLKSNDYFDLRNEKTKDAFVAYKKRSKNDVIRSIRLERLDSKGLRKLLREKEKHGFSEVDVSVIRLFLRQRVMRESRQKVDLLKRLKQSVILSSGRMMESDENAIAGIEAAKRVAVVASGTKEAARFVARGSVVAHDAWTKYGIVGRQVGRAERYVKKQAKDGSVYIFKKTAYGVRAIKQSAKEVIGESETVRGIKDVLNSVKEVVSGTKAVQKFKAIEKEARKRQRAISSKVARAKYAAGKAKQGIEVATTPFRFFKRGIGKIYKFLSGVRAVVCGTLFAVVISYVILVVLLTGILSVFTIEGEAAMNIILCSDEDFVARTIDKLSGYFSEEKEGAIVIATGSPQNPEVFYGHTIDRYGAPDADGNWSDGYKIYYQDIDGNVIENGVNNIKDVIVLAYVLMDGDFDTNEKARDELIEDLWEQMNPDIYWEETDIYTAEVGDDTYYYSCMEAKDYAEMNAMRVAGVRFYADVVTYSENGCGSTTHIGARWEGGNLVPTVEYDYFCYGHSVPVCYGHKDIKVYVTVGFMEDMFSNPNYPDGKSYQKYLKQFEVRGGWTEDAIEWANALYASDWYDVYGIDPAGGVGFSVADTLSAEEIARITEQYGGIDGTRQAIASFALDMVGKIPYYWGGKPSSGDYDGNHFYSDVKSDGSQYNRTKRGLDCSGFVAFAYWHILGQPISARSTGDFTNGQYRRVSANDLKVGDVGLLRTGYSNGCSVNHIGIFVGRDSAGNALWVHCTGGKTSKTVCGTYNFSVYYSLLD